MSRYYSLETIRANAYDVTLANGAKHRCIDPDALLDIEPADVREDVKGEWEHGDETARHYLGDACVQIDYAYWRCSACGKVYEQSDKPKYNFCPNCGSQMMKGGDA